MGKVREFAAFRDRERSAEVELDGLIRQWRESPASSREGESGAEMLGEERRARILAEVRRMRRGREPAFLWPLASLFLPARRLALAGTLPALLLALALGWLLVPLGHRELAGGPVRLDAIKRGDEVVFLIANGGSTHRIYRGENPQGLRQGHEAYATTDRAFRDRLDRGGSVVFYRID